MEYETSHCIVCGEPSEGRIATGNVTQVDGTEVIATFCSQKCESRAPKPDRMGTFGPWTRGMGQIPWRLSQGQPSKVEIIP
jgi:predicted nucleic acid-binding Zn ribbon protein